MDENFLDKTQILLARQPIFDRQLKVVAYELLYRDGECGDAVFYNGEHATSVVLLNTYTSIFDRGSIKQVPAFINLTREMLLQQSIPQHLEQQVVLEILEDIEIDESLINSVRKLKDDGFQIALDDFTFSEKYTQLLELVDIVKVDILPFSCEQLEDQVRILQPYDVTLLAEKIETLEQMQYCVELGFSLFQGFFLCKPQLIKGKKLTSNSMAILQMAQRLQDPEITVKEIEALIIKDPALTYKLLRIINSAAYTLANKVETLSQAIVMLGVDQIRKWVTLIAVGSNEEKPEELTRILLTRGRMCELLAQSMLYTNANSYFMVGMMSEINALLDIEMNVLLEKISLHDDIKQAISDHSGPMGQVLRATIAYERAEWDRLPEFGIDDALYENSYRQSIQWAHEAMIALKG